MKRGNVVIEIAVGKWRQLVGKNLHVVVRGALAGAFLVPAAGITADDAAPAIGVEAICRSAGQPEVKKVIVLNKEGTQVNSLADCRQWLTSDRSQAVRKLACIEPFGMQPKLKSIKCVQVKDQAAEKPQAAQ